MQSSTLKQFGDQNLRSGDQIFPISRQMAPEKKKLISSPVSNDNSSIWTISNCNTKIQHLHVLHLCIVFLSLWFV